MNEEGVIKFNCNWIKAGALPYEHIAELNQWRDQLYAVNLIGENQDGIGYGNISCRSAGHSFIITGSGTGSIKKLGAEHFTSVIDYHFSENSLTTKGPLKASSESLTHAAVYESVPAVNFVFHVHHLELWKKLLLDGVVTAKQVPYGTPEMAGEIMRLLKTNDLDKLKILAMGGHEEGIISFGKTAEEAGKAILDCLYGL